MKWIRHDSIWHGLNAPSDQNNSSADQLLSRSSNARNKIIIDLVVEHVSNWFFFSSQIHFSWSMNSHNSFASSAVTIHSYEIYTNRTYNLLSLFYGAILNDFYMKRVDGFDCRSMRMRLRLIVINYILCRMGHIILILYFIFIFFFFRYLWVTMKCCFMFIWLNEMISWSKTECEKWNVFIFRFFKFVFLHSMKHIYIAFNDISLIQ